MTDEEALHAAVRDRPHDSTPRLVLADYYDDHGMSEHAVAHRWLSGEHPTPNNYKEWQEQTGHLDGSKVARVLSEEAEKSTEVANRATGPLTRMGNDGINHVGRLLTITTINAQNARRRATEGGSNLTARGNHSMAAANHETIANNHESQSYYQEHDPEHLKRLPVQHETAGKLQRRAQTHHVLASSAHDYTDEDHWRKSQGSD